MYYPLTHGGNELRRVVCGFDNYRHASKWLLIEGNVTLRAIRFGTQTVHLHAPDYANDEGRNRS
jgi:hypothetical protein